MTDDHKVFIEAHKPDARVWLGSNGNVVTDRSENGYRELTEEAVVHSWELPADARPMVVLPKELAEDLAFLEFLEAREAAERESSVEAARRKVLEDLKPGVYNMRSMVVVAIQPHTLGVVLPDGQFLVRQHDDGCLYDLTDGFEDKRRVYRFTLLAEGDLSPVIQKRPNSH